MDTSGKMKVEIWSDVMCPFCYMGKRKFEAALTEFKDAEYIEIVWKSFQLAPDMKTEPGKNIHQFLADHKGMSIQQAKGLNDQVANMAKPLSLVYDFDRAVPANSFMAHRFSHLALHHGVQDAAEEKLFQAYFTEGKNIDDLNTLAEMGEEIGIDKTETLAALEGNSYADEVTADIHEAHQLGVNGVPFFVFDRKYAVSGAQETKTFSEVLAKSYEEWQKENSSQGLEVSEGPSCKVGEDCN